jgi:hypothetical protein
VVECARCAGEKRLVEGGEHAHGDTRKSDIDRENNAVSVQDKGKQQLFATFCTVCLTFACA